jgi:SPP1 gp7 family putative phage head morphogenesis protein
VPAEATAAKETTRVQPGSGLSDPLAPPADPTAAGTAPNADDPGANAADQQTLGLLARRLTEQHKAAIWRNLQRRVRDLESRTESRWRDHLSHLRSESLHHIHRKGGPRPITKDETSPAPGDVDAGHLFDISNADQEIIIQLEPIWRGAIGRGADSVAEQTGISIDFSSNDPAVRSALTRRKVIIRGTDRRIASTLRELLNEGLAANESEEDLKRRVVDFFDSERANARTVARTETFSAFSEGRFAAMHEAGIERQSWLTSRDDRVRDSHADLEGEVVIIGDTFSNGLRFPLDPSGDPGEVINCRCVTLPEIAA